MSKDPLPRRLARWLLGGFMIFAGLAHLTFARQAFRAQVPPWLPLPPDAVVVASGLVEIGLGLALLLWGGQRVGWVLAVFFVLVFPGNLPSLYTTAMPSGLTLTWPGGCGCCFSRC